MGRETIDSNVSFLLGDYTDGYLTVEGTKDDILKKGSLLVYNKLTGKYKAYSGGTEKPVAIVLVGTTIPAAGYIDTPVAIEGLFNGNGLELPDGAALDTVQKSSGSAIAITAAEGNTGDGTAGTITQGSLAKEGAYTLECSNAAVSGSEVFSVYDPENIKLDDLTVGVAYDNGHFAVTISDGYDDFIVGDTFTVVPQINADGTPRMLMKESGLVVKDVVQMYA